MDLTARLEELGATSLPLVLDRYPEKQKRVPWAAKSTPIRVRSADYLATLPRPESAIQLHWYVDPTRPFTQQVLNEFA